MKNKKKTILRIVGRVGIVLLTTVLLLTGGLWGAMWMLVNGPSPTICKLFVNTVKETSAGGFLADLYLTPEQIKALTSTPDTDSDEDIDSSLIVITPPGSDLRPTEKPGVPSTGDDDPPEEDTGIEVVDVSGSTYYGKMMIVKDPRRVIVGTPDRFGSDAKGLTVEKMIQKYGAVAGINAGGFYDPDGNGTGGIPDGLVITDGVLRWGNLDTSYSIAGLDANGLLHVGKMTARKALAAGIQYAVSWGPALISNGKVVTSNESSLNPRTAIGQRADGALLLLVINGRSPSSLGATYLDLAGIMLDFGAVNATNLDGGSSSIMIYKNEFLTNSAYIFGIRIVATSFLVI